MRRRNVRGQGNTEYVIIIALVGIATIGIVTLFGDNVRRLFGASADSLGGDTDIANPATIGGVPTEKDMSNFATQNTAYDPGGLPGRTGPSTNSAR